MARREKGCSDRGIGDLLIITRVQVCGLETFFDGHKHLSEAYRPLQKRNNSETKSLKQKPTKCEAKPFGLAARTKFRFQIADVSPPSSRLTGLKCHSDPSAGNARQHAGHAGVPQVKDAPRGSEVAERQDKKM